MDIEQSEAVQSLQQTHEPLIHFPLSVQSFGHSSSANCSTNTSAEAGFPSSLPLTSMDKFLAPKTPHCSTNNDTLPLAKARSPVSFQNSKKKCKKYYMRKIQKIKHSYHKDAHRTQNIKNILKRTTLSKNLTSLDGFLNQLISLDKGHQRAHSCKYNQELSFSFFAFFFLLSSFKSLLCNQHVSCHS